LRPSNQYILVKAISSFSSRGECDVIKYSLNLFRYNICKDLSTFDQ
jgi:hypothetical protein